VKCGILRKNGKISGFQRPVFFTGWESEYENWECTGLCGREMMGSEESALFPLEGAERGMPIRRKRLISLSFI
jgi:hypothetical protein